MGTRADFYLRRSLSSMYGSAYGDVFMWAWLGSIDGDGHPEGIPAQYKILKSKSEKKFRKRVLKLLLNEGGFDGTTWPWPGSNSLSTDYTYVWDADENKLFLSCFGYGWRTVEEWSRFLFDFEHASCSATCSCGFAEPKLWDDEKTCVFPTMRGE